METLKFDWRILLLLCLDLAVILLDGRTLFGEFSRNGTKLLRFYTQDSNLLAVAACSALAFCEIACLISGRALPDWTRLVRFIPACCLAVTLLVSAFLLSPGDGGFAATMLRGPLLYLHTLCPLLMIAAFLLHPGAPLGAGDALLALTPTVIYAAVTLWRNILRLERGPYFFFHIYEQPGYVSALWVAAILGGNFLIAWGLTGLRRVVQMLLR